MGLTERWEQLAQFAYQAVGLFLSASLAFEMHYVDAAGVEDFVRLEYPCGRRGNRLPG